MLEDSLKSTGDRTSDVPKDLLNNETAFNGSKPNNSTEKTNGNFDGNKNAPEKQKHPR